MKTVLERLEKLEAAAAADVMVAMGLVNQVLSPDITPLGTARIIGRALCAEGTDNVETGAIATFELDKAVTPDDVVVIASGGYQKGALIGDNMVTSMQQRGARGFILDSGVRDADVLASGSLPVYCMYNSPTNGHRFWSYSSIGQPITLPGIWGDVCIHPGDFILGDEDGVCVLPKAHIVQIMTDTEVHMQAEAQIKRAIQAGIPRDQATRDSRRLQHVKPITSHAVTIEE